LKTFKIYLGIGVVISLFLLVILGTYVPSKEVFALVGLLTLSFYLIIIMFQIILTFLAKARAISIRYFILSTIVFCIFFGFLVWFSYLNK
jgi:hypothetical protein